MKKLLCILFFPALAALLFACGTTRVPVDTELREIAPTPEATALPSDAPDGAPEQDGVTDFDRGTYENPYFGIGMKAGKDIELLDPGGFPGGLLYARSADGRSLLFLFKEELGKDADAADYLAGHKDAASELLQEKALEDAKSVTETVFFAGAERPCLFISGTVEGVKVFERHICIQNGPHICVISLASFGEDRTLRLADLFHSTEDNTNF